MIGKYPMVPVVYLINPNDVVRDNAVKELE